MKIYLCVNKGDEHKDLVQRISKAILDSAKEKSLNLELEVRDVGLYGEQVLDSPALVFGSFAKGQVESKNVYCLPDLGSLENRPGNVRARKSAMNTIDLALTELTTSFSNNKHQETIAETYSVEKEDTTIGIGEVDITIPPEKIEYLQRLKALLNCNQIKIRKGDLELEFK
jgi:hypothetical protein